ncbi:uncharacterized protein LOC134231683 [Saccostrea cucullata]|uniref:uncharacterized protein LOC134231683 n=1 Tax=Saccostrea cuccullata TaxID=36930 RepID=UPI002ED01FD2
MQKRQNDEEKERKKPQKIEMYRKDRTLKEEKVNLKHVKDLLKTTWSAYIAEVKKKDFSSYEDIIHVKRDIISRTARLTSQLSQITNALLHKENGNEDSKIKAYRVELADGLTEYTRDDRKAAQRMSVTRENRQSSEEPQPDYFDQDTENTSKNLSEEYAKAQCSLKELDIKNKKLTEELHKLKEELKEKEKKIEGTKKDAEDKDIQKDSNEKETEKNYRGNHSNKYKDNSQNGPNQEEHADERHRLQHKQGPDNKETQQQKLKGEYQYEINRLKEDLDKTTKDNDWKIRELEAKLQNEEQGKSTLQAQVKKITFEKNEALTRLSEIAGRRLLENNPSIADLSTEIRPTKIGENFKQLYDNEWTEAFEELTEQGKTEEECIETLLHIVQDTFTFAMEEAKSFESRLISIVISFPGNANSSNTNTTKDEEELIKQLKRVSAARTCTAVQDVYVREIKIKENIGERLKLYARKCMELCWYMAVQSPPMVIVSAVQCKGPFDEKYYSRYTATGDLIDYVVWPCTLLHENGPVLAKGVAQATKDNREAFKRKQAPAAPKQNSDERWSSTKQGAVGQEGISNPNTRYQKKDEKNKNEQNVHNKTEGGRFGQSDGSTKTQTRSKSVYVKPGTKDESSVGGLARSHSVKTETFPDNKGKHVTTIKL